MAAGEITYAFTADGVPVTRHLFVRNLSWSTDSATLAAFFARYGKIETSRVVIDEYTGRSRGIGFVSFCRREDARRALAHPNNLIDERMTICYPKIPNVPRPHHHPQPRPPNANAPPHGPANDGGFNCYGYNGPPPGYGGRTHVPSTGPAQGYQNARFQEPGFQRPPWFWSAQATLPPGYQNARFQEPGFQRPPRFWSAQATLPPGYQNATYQRGPAGMDEVMRAPAGPMGRYWPY